MTQKGIISILFLIISIQSTGQLSYINPSQKELRKSRPVYINLGIGDNYSVFRDFATSPLFYKGHMLSFSLSRLKIDNIKESCYGSSLSAGVLNATVKSHSTYSIATIFSLYYAKLHQVPNWSNEKWNFKAGGTLNTTGNFRYNKALQNNSTGFEAFITLFGSAKIARDVSRKHTKEKKLLFIKYILFPRKRILSYQLNLGLLNNSFRNGYAYIGQSSELNDFKLFDGYIFKSFSGFRMNSSLDYTVLLNNKNAVQISYAWDAYTTGGNLDKFEMANHIIKLSLQFNIK